MLFLAAFLFTASIYSCVRPLEVQTKLSARCSFGDQKQVLPGNTRNMSASLRSLTFSGQLPPSRNVSHSCFVKTDNPNRLLYLRAKRNEKLESIGSLHVSVYGAQETSHLDISESAVGWSTLPFCPSTNERYITISGTINLRFSVEMLPGKDIKLDKSEEARLNAKDPYPAVYQFTPEEDISDRQLDITVTSESDVPAYLKVSHHCKDVKDNIKVVDYKGESLRLSFAKKGRITLSKFSIPSLTGSTSSWFIGIAIKNATGDTPSDATKTVTLNLSRSFDYSYDLPMWISQLVVSVLGGLLASLWAWYIFRECICSQCSSKVQSCQLQKCCQRSSEEETQLLVQTEARCCSFCKAMCAIIRNHFFGRGPKTYSYITLIVGSALMVGAFQFVFAHWYLMIQEGDRDHCYYNDFCYRVRYADIPYNLIVSNLTYFLHGVILALNVLCMESEVFARCRKLAPIAKKEIEIWKEREKIKREKKVREKNVRGTKEIGKSEREEKEREENQNGRSDHEDQNRATESESHAAESENTSEVELLPNHVLTCPDIFLHFKEMRVPKCKLEDKDKDEFFAEARKKMFTFSMGYAFAWALCFEGLFSALYHFCPTKLTFQFDTAFMFVIAGLIVALLYNGIEMKECSDKVAKRLLGAAKFFLYFVTPLLVFNYFGIMYHSEAGLALTIKILLIISLAVWCLFMICWVVYKLYTEIYKKDNNNVICDCDCRACKCWERCCTPTFVLIFFCIIGLVVAPVVLVILWATTILEFTDAFLYCCIAETCVAALGSLCMSPKNCHCKSSCQNCKAACSDIICATDWACCCCCSCTKLLFNKTIHKFFFILITLVFLVAGVAIFVAKETTNKGKSPEKSRDLNQECFLFNFFDYHDLWHILSSFGLLMGSLMAIHISYESPELPSNPEMGGNESV